MLGYGAGLAAILYAFNYTGGQLTGYGKDPMIDEVGRKEYLRRNRRHPVEDTVAELGEGRGGSTFMLVLPYADRLAQGYTRQDTNLDVQRSYRHAMA